MLALLLVAASACGGESAGRPEAPAPAAAPAPAPAAALPAAPSGARAPELDTAPAAAAPTRIVVVGDSLTAGYGLDEDEAYPVLLERELGERGWSVEVVNGGVSGDTTAGGRARLDWLLRQGPAIVVLALGANDSLRGLPAAAAEENLREMVRASRAAGALVLLAGMKVPPNYGAEYSAGFEAIYPRLAAELEVALMPFLLAGVGGHPELNQADGIHPNAEGQRRIAAGLAPYLEPLLASLEPAGGREGT